MLRNAILLTATALLLVCGCGLEPASPRSPAAKEPSHRWEAAELKVFQAVIAISTIPKRVLAVNWTADLPLDIPTQWKNEVPRLVQRYRGVQRDHFDLPQEFPLAKVHSEEVRFIRTQAQADWHQLAQSHQGAQGVLELTPIGLATDKRDAIVGYRFYHNFDPQGYREDLSWLWLTENHDQWILVRRVDTGRKVVWSRPPSSSPTTKLR